MTVRDVRLFSITCQATDCQVTEHYVVPKGRSTPAAAVRFQAGIEGWVHDSRKDLCPNHADRATPPPANGREALRRRRGGGAADV